MTPSLALARYRVTFEALCSLGGDGYEDWDLKPDWKPGDVVTL